MNKFRYGLDKDSDKVVYIKYAKNGLLCNCICRECNSLLVACQGDREWYFRHYNKDTKCIGAQETLIHKLAKEIIFENSNIETPHYTILYENPELEIELPPYIPDVTVTSNNEKIYFEIVVKNKLSLEKIDFYKKNKYKSIEINLSNISYDTDPNTLKNLVLTKKENKKIIYWEDKSESINKKNKPITDSGDSIFLKILFSTLMFILGLITFKFILDKLKRNKRKKRK